MQTVSVELKVPKESKEVADAVFGIVADIKAKKSIAEIAGAALPNAIVAVEGYDMLDDEAKSAHKADLAAYLAKKIVEAL